MQQKIDKVAIAIAVLIILGGIIWTFFGEDPGSVFAKEIEGYRDDIDLTTSQQTGVDLGDPEALDDALREKFRVESPGRFPEWSFYRRPATYTFKIIADRSPPVLLSGKVCRVEVVRVPGDPHRTLHRVTGFRGNPENAKIIAEVLEHQLGDGEWEEVGPVGTGEGGSSYEIDAEQGLRPGESYSYRLLTRASSKNDMNFSGESSKVKTTTTDPSEPMLYPFDQSWEVTALQPGGVVGDKVEPGRATVVLHFWDWDLMKTDRNTRTATEGSPEKLFGSQYSLHLIRMDLNPAGVKLKGDARGDVLTLQKGIKPLPLDPPAWESEDPACTGKDEQAGQEQQPNETPPPTVVGEVEKPTGGGGGLFGGDD